MTAAHCIITKFSIRTTICTYYYFGYCSYYSYDYVYVNVSDPFDLSQYSAYLGVHNQYELTQPVIQMSVNKIIRVIKLIRFEIHKNLKHN